MINKKYKSKWSLIGVNHKLLKKIYSRNRLKAYTILKNRHLKEYSFILSSLMFEDYKIKSAGYELMKPSKSLRVREILKGGKA